MALFVTPGIAEKHSLAIIEERDVGIRHFYKMIPMAPKDIDNQRVGELIHPKPE